MRNSSFSYLPSALVIDIPEIDAQHAHLFEQLEVFKASCIERNEVPVDEAEALFSTLVEHCRTEERLAREAGLDFRRHGEKHAAMLHSIRNVLDDMERPGVDVFGLIRYVGCWFERHIREEDKSLGLDLLQVTRTDRGQQLTDGLRERPSTC
ncbi:MAG: hemerythrin family protein [Betaproteobacteria bacterium]|nr:hemerythrin family protein [Betaproteobacteria bacterium]